MYLDFEAAQAAGADDHRLRMQSIYYRALQGCPRSKALYLDSIRHSPHALQEVIMCRGWSLFALITRIFDRLWIYCKRRSCIFARRSRKSQRYQTCPKHLKMIAMKKMALIQLRLMLMLDLDCQLSKRFRTTITSDYSAIFSSCSMQNHNFQCLA